MFLPQADNLRAESAFVKLSQEHCPMVYYRFQSNLITTLNKNNYLKNQPNILHESHPNYEYIEYPPPERSTTRFPRRERSWSRMRWSWSLTGNLLGKLKWVSTGPRLIHCFQITSADISPIFRVISTAWRKKERTTTWWTEEDKRKFTVSKLNRRTIILNTDGRDIYILLASL